MYSEEVYNFTVTYGVLWVNMAVANEEVIVT